MYINVIMTDISLCHHDRHDSDFYVMKWTLPAGISVASFPGLSLLCACTLHVQLNAGEEKWSGGRRPGQISHMMLATTTSRQVCNTQIVHYTRRDVVVAQITCEICLPLFFLPRI